MCRLICTFFVHGINRFFHDMAQILSDSLILADVITDQTTQQHQGMEEEQENIVGPDKFLLNVLRKCHQVRNLTLYMHEITDRAGQSLKLLNLYTVIWAAVWQYQHNHLCTQRRLRSAWASSQSDQGLRCVLFGYLRIQCFFMRTRRLIRLGGSESLLGTQVIFWFCRAAAHVHVVCFLLPDNISKIQRHSVGAVAELTRWEGWAPPFSNPKHP